MDEARSLSLKRAAGFAAALMAGAVMGISWPLQKYVLGQEIVGPAVLHWLNVFVLLALAAPGYLLRHHGRLRWEGFSPGWLLLLGAVACVMHYSRNFGLHATTATTAAVVERSEVVFVFLLTYLVLKSRVRPLGWLGTVLVLYGTIRVALIGAAALNFNPLGVIALVIVGLTIAVNALIIKTKLTTIPNELIIVGSMVVQLVVFSVMVPATGLLPEVARLLEAPLLIGLVVAGSIAWGTRLLLYYYALKRAPVWAVMMLTLTGLPVATLADLLVLRAPVTLAHIEGLIAVTAGAVLVISAAGGRAARESARR